MTTIVVTSKGVSTDRKVCIDRQIMTMGDKYHISDDNKVALFSSGKRPTPDQYILIRELFTEYLSRPSTDQIIKYHKKYEFLRDIANVVYMTHGNILLLGFLVGPTGISIDVNNLLDGNHHAYGSSSTAAALLLELGFKRKKIYKTIGQVDGLTSEEYDYIKRNSLSC